MQRLILGLCVFLAACNSQLPSSPSAPSIAATIGTTQTQPEEVGRPVEVTFTKWLVDPATRDFVGFTGGEVVGTMATRVLRSTPFDNGVIVQLEARYGVIDPSGLHSFTAHVQGQRNTETASAVLNGLITDGWLVGAQVQVKFDVITPCQFGTRNVCFQGTIRVMPGSAQ
jgi:hypothetical protein